MARKAYRGHSDFIDGYCGLVTGFLDYFALNLFNHGDSSIVQATAPRPQWQTILVTEIQVDDKFA